MKGMTLLRAVTWDQVFVQWQSAEAWQPSWQAHWTERGFDSWEAWRTRYAAPITPEKRAWQLYKIDTPTVVCDFYGTPTKGWIQKCYDGDLSRRLHVIQDHPTIADNAKIQAIAHNFPVLTMLTGLTVGEDIYLIEGMHRANALVYMYAHDLPVEAEVYIALATIEVDELHPLGSG